MDIKLRVIKTLSIKRQIDRLTNVVHPPRHAAMCTGKIYLSYAPFFWGRKT